MGNKDPQFRKRSPCTVHSEIREQIPADLLDELLSKLELGTVQIRVSYVRSVAYQYHTGSVLWLWRLGGDQNCQKTVAGLIRRVRGAGTDPVF